MKKFSAVSIRTRLMLVVMTTTVAALLVALLTMAFVDDFSFRQRVLQQAMGQARLVAENSTAALSFADVHAADETLHSLSADSHVGAAAIYDKEGALFAQFVRNGRRGALPDRWSGNSVFFRDDRLIVSEPVLMGRQFIGTVLMQTDLDELGYRKSQVFILIAEVLLLGAGLGYLLAGRLQRFISNPIRQLSETSRAVAAEKNYSWRVEKNSDDEFGRLVDAFNEMLSQIEKRDAALREAQTQLEHRVEERTQDLFETNARLQTEMQAHIRAREESDALREQLEGVCHDLQQEAEERVGVQEALRRSEERFSKAFRASPVPLAIVTRQARAFVDVNDRFAELVGADRDEIIGANLFEMSLWTVAETRARLEQLLADGLPMHNWECRIAGHGAETRAALLSAVTFMLGGESCLLLMTEDISERVNLEGQLRQAQKMEAIGQLASGVAHDFNNLLTIIQGHTELVLASQNGDGMVKQALQRVVGATQRAAQLTRQLLTFGRKQVAKPRPLDLNQVIGNVTSMLRPLLGEMVRMIWKPSPVMPSLEGDAAMLEQVIVNLVLNARDAMSRGGDLIISTFICDIDAAHSLYRPEARPGKFACLQVSDSGCGMDAATLDRIFEPFFTTKGVGKGTGLGLATAYSIVKQHRGWIEVVSHVGIGTTFKIFLPVAAPSETANESGADAANVKGGHETILVVEDEPALRELLTTVLRGFGYSVLEASHGKDALAAWQRAAIKPDLLLTDLMMPEGMNGWELAERLRALTKGLKVVFTSGYSPELFGSQPHFQSHANFLPKPFHPRSLAQTVRQCLDNN